jgi:tetratricopeptide (TPR) repeat protein
MALEAGRVSEAIEIFSGLISSEPRAELHYYRALAYGRKHEYKPALDDLAAAISLESQQPAYHLQKGLFLLRTGRNAEAIQACTRALELDPGNAKAFGCRARAYLRQGSTANALEDARTAIQLNPANGAWYVLRGDIRGSTGDYGNAIQDYDQALQMCPGDAVAYNNRGVALANLGKNREAVEDLNRAMDIASSASASGNGQGPAATPW